jgi:hypothetical protein
MTLPASGAVVPQTNPPTAPPSSQGVANSGTQPQPTPTPSPQTSLPPNLPCRQPHTHPTLPAPSPSAPCPTAPPKASQSSKTHTHPTRARGCPPSSSTTARLPGLRNRCIQTSFSLSPLLPSSIAARIAPRTRARSAPIGQSYIRE